MNGVLDKTSGCSIEPSSTQPHVDRLTPLLAHFSPKAALHFHGKSCDQSSFCPKGDQSYLHLVESGSGSILLDQQEIAIVEPCLIYIPRGDAHSFKSVEPDSLQLYCATIDAGQVAGNPILTALPAIKVIPLSACSSLRELIQMIWRENTAMYCGREAAVNRLTEYLLILLLRHILSDNPPQSGLMAGLADRKLALVFNALHKQPQLDWDLEQMAQEAGMSRARFAEHFRKVVGCTPNDYLTQWRLTLARKQLLAGDSLKQVAPAVGYQSVAAFHRVFRSRFGQTPKEWLHGMSSHAA
ncbi:AraC family transcriptional regulator [Rheinheimera riviphila]|nr:AraC family transcriptional regulator [Rheinheimera riviphila]